MSDERLERELRAALLEDDPGPVGAELRARIHAVPDDVALPHRLVRSPRHSRLLGWAAAIAAVVLVSATLVGLGGRWTSVGPAPSVPASIGPISASPPASQRATIAPSPTPTPGAVVTTSIGNMLFVMPASWQQVMPRIWTEPIGPRLFLSNAPIADPCAVSFRGGECWKPLAELPPDGILVTFSGSATLSLPKPSPVAYVIAVSGWCKEIGGERALISSFPGFGVSACLRGPDYAANEAAFERILSSMKRP